MATTEKTAGKTATEVKRTPKQNGGNADAIIAKHLEQMRAYGRDKKAGDSAKQNAIELFQADCLSGIANIGMVDRYVDAYCDGASLTGNSRSAFKSSLTAFGDPNVIKAWPTFSAALNRMHDSKDKDVKALVSRTTTGKDKFNQLYRVAKVIRDMKGATPAITDKWLTDTIAPESKSKEELAKLARKSIADSVTALLPAKPTKAQLDVAIEFCKTFGVELPAALKPKK